MLSWMAENKVQGLQRWSSILLQLQDPSQEGTEETEWRDLGGPSSSSSMNDLLYANLACEHEKFEDFGWPKFRSLLEANAVAGFPLEEAVTFFSDLALAILGEATEKHVRSYNHALQEFFTNLTRREIDVGLEHCHLGVASALLVQALRELKQADVPSKVALFVGLAHELISPVMEAPKELPSPLGTWPIEELMAHVSDVMEARQRLDQEMPYIHPNDSHFGSNSRNVLSSYTKKNIQKLYLQPHP